MEFDRHAIIVREAKGNKDRVVMLPQSLAPAVRQHIQKARALWGRDRQTGRGGVQTPHALGWIGSIPTWHAVEILLLDYSPNEIWQSQRPVAGFFPRTSPFPMNAGTPIR